MGSHPKNGTHELKHKPYSCHYLVTGASLHGACYAETHRDKVETAEKRDTYNNSNYQAQRAGPTDTHCTLSLNPYITSPTLLINQRKKTRSEIR